MRPDFPANLEARFEVQGILGEGSMGVVYLARDRELARTVAVKVMTHPGVPSARSRFQREARLLAGLHHPNLVQIYEARIDHDNVYLVMEHLQGQVLHQMRPPHDLRGVALAIGEALDVIHGSGVIHRDVKPANLFQTDDGRTVLMDLGVAFTPDETRLTGERYLVGTLAFLSPEAFQGLDPSPAVDWWALGATLFLLAEGRVPFETKALLAAIDGAPLPAPEYLVLQPDTRERRLVEGLLEPDGEARLQGVEALRAILDPASPRRHRRRRSRKGRPSSRLVLGAAGLALAPLVGIGLLGPWGPGSGPTPAEHGAPLDSSAIGGDFPAEVRAQYFALESEPDASGGSLLAPDPAHWGPVLARCPALAKALDATAAAGGEEHLPAGDRQGLAAVDRFFEGQGFDPPFLAVRSTRPVTTPEWPHELPSRGSFWPDPPGPASGWLGRVYRAANQLKVSRRRRALDRKANPRPPDFPAFLDSPVARVLDLDRALGHARVRAGARREVHAWVRPDVDEYRRLLYALIRAIEAGEPKALGQAPVLLEMGNWLLPVSLATAPPRWLLGVPPETPARRLLVAMVRRRLLNVTRDVTGELPVVGANRLLEEFAILRDLASEPGAPRLLGPVAWTETLEVLRKLDEHEQAIEVFGTIQPPPWTWEDTTAAWGVLRSVGGIFRDLGERSPPGESTRAGVQAFAARWKAAGHPRSLGLLQDFGLAPPAP